ncbi:Glycogen synthase [Planctomycetes bacterium Poly30]|uniref:starch synthase n=1 Tax=Saltatorellus ferox TaxID=2528018 RepID=A0A518ETT6_9BACT|nr:Glycogen synthase [Planctomycetes bacterium Poly30]
MKASKMNVLVLGWEYPPAVAGGLGAACQGLTRALAARGHGVQLALPDACRPYHPPGHGSGEAEAIFLGTSSGEAGVEDARGALFHPYASDEVHAATQDPGRGPAGWGAAGARLYGRDLIPSVRAYTRSAVERLAHLDFDVIHAHDWMTFPAALQLRLATGRPVCLHVHSTAYDRGGSPEVAGQLGLERGSIASVERAGVRTADAVAAVSAYTGRVLVDHYGADSDRIRVVHNAPSRHHALSGAASGQNAAPSPAASAPGRPVSPRTQKTVLCLGRLTRQKGVSFLLRAAKVVLMSHPDARFLVAGEGEERTRLIEMVAELGLAGKVHFLGSISDEAKVKAYREADVFVLPSVSEPFGLTPLEALAEGTPVVLSKASGVAEVLPSAPAVEPWDYVGMASEISALLDSRGKPGGLAERLVASGQREMASLSWDRSAAALESALAFAISRGGRVVPTLQEPVAKS